MLSALELELANNDERDLWNEAYKRLRAADGGATQPTTLAAKHPDNRLLNRYRDVLPYDHSRVRLLENPWHSVGGGGGTDYINASLVRAEHAGRVYAMAQGPLPVTSGHFWLMVWQLGCRGVVMLNRVFEKGALKCHQYFPEERGRRSVEFPEEGLRVDLASAESHGYYVVRRCRLTLAGEAAPRDILHFQYLTWPDFGVPQAPGAFLNFLMAVRRAGLLADPSRPPVVHCSAGIGRTGTLAVVDVCLALIARRGSLYGVDLPGEVRRLRRDRMGLVQTPDQLRFCYQAVVMGGRALLAAGSGVDPDSLTFSVDESENPRRSGGVGVGMANNSGRAAESDSDSTSSTSDDSAEDAEDGGSRKIARLLRGNLRAQRTTWLSCQHRLSGATADPSDPAPFPLYNEEAEAADDAAAATVARCSAALAETMSQPAPHPPPPPPKEPAGLAGLAWISLLVAVGGYLVYRLGE